MFGAAAREVRFLLRSPWDLAVVTIFPLLSILLPLWIFSSGTVRHAPIAVVDRDGTALTRSFVRELDALESVRVAYTPAGLEEAMRLAREGSASAIVYFPRGTERDVLRGKQAPILSFVNTMYALPAGLITRDLQTLFATDSVKLAVIALGKHKIPENEGIALAAPLEPDLISLYNARTNYEAFLADTLIPALLQLLLMFAVVSAFGREFRDGSVNEWLRSAGGGTLAATAGKALPYFLAWCFFGCAGTLAAAALNGWQHGIAVVMLATVVFMAAYVGISLAVIGIIGNMRLALSASSVIAAPAFAYAGITFPQYNMPPLARWWSELLPLTWYLQLRVAQLQFHAGAADAVRPIAVMLVFALFCTAAGLVSLRSLAATPQAWFKR